MNAFAVRLCTRFTALLIGLRLLGSNLCHAQGTEDTQQLAIDGPWSLRLTPRLAATPMNAGGRAFSFSISDVATTTSDEDIALKGQAQVRQHDSIVKGDAIHYSEDTDRVDSYGHVRVVNGGNLLTGPEAHLQIGPMEGYMVTPKYHFHLSNGSGSGERIDIVDRERSTITHGTYTACQCADDPAWYVRATKFEIDTEANEGVAHNGVLFFLGAPVLATPWLSFPLNSERKSGLLPPTVSYSSGNGFDSTIPYYFNLAPNYDLTLTGRLMSSRGILVSPDYRYLSPTYSGEVSVSYLPYDAVYKNKRYSISIKHNQDLGHGLSAYVTYNRVSDADFNTDLGAAESYLNGAQTLYQQEAGLLYNKGPWSVMLREQRWQSLDSSPPYSREPEFDGVYSRYNLIGFDVGAQINATRFTITTSDTTQGDRLVFNPYLSYSIVRPSFFFTPKIQWHFASYRLKSIGSDAPSSQPKDFSVNMPTLSIDSGLTFQRTVSFFGLNLVQTLEPRLFYVYTPYRNQAFAPLFDTASKDFGLAEIFTENTFIGNDRVADQSRLTAALTTRFLSPESGAELAKFVIAQQYYFREPRVTLTSSDTASSSDHSDVILGASFRSGDGLTAEQAVQFNQKLNQLERASIGFAWTPAERHVLNAAYRYTRSNESILDNQPISQAIISEQWPLSVHFSTIARVNFDMRVHRITAGLLGLQYDAQCWSLGLAVQRYTKTSNVATGTSGSRVLIQLQLKGLSDVDTGLIDEFKASVPGYMPLPAAIPSQSVYSDYE